MTKIVAVDPIFLFPKHTKLLKEFGELVTFDTVPKNSSEILNRIKGADIVIDYWTALPKEVLENLKNTKMICSASAGYEWIDIETASKKGITITHCPGHNCEAVAELTIGLMLSALRHICKAVNETRGGSYKPAGYKSKELKDKTLGIIGYGTIGKRVAEIAEKGFGMKVLFTNSKSTPADLKKLLKVSDIISVNAPLNDKTKNLLGKYEFDLMKEGVIFVNTGRGAIVDETALFNSLKSGKIYAAGLDLLADEPYKKDNPLFKLQNVVITPHIAWNTEEADYRLSAQVVEIISAFVSGKPVYIVPEQRR
ncbi:MAG: hypothetical protein NUV65_00665 [Candidatus Roizmanbacteria bacterium]|nr:hypothetical protein [Candidatus Roizmanbacteria bacterium]